MSYGKKLTIEQQIEHMKEQGITFHICNEKDAIQYLAKNNNYFKLRAYRKNYVKDGKGKYVGLDFAYLKDIAIIDMRMRYCFLEMCLDIEHVARMQVIKTIVDSVNEDGYTVVTDFQIQYPQTYGDILGRASKSIYCADLQKKYLTNMPVWVLVEMMQFSDLCMFYRFVSKRLKNANMRKEFYIFQEIRQLRNACAHSNCILNDLKSSHSIKHKPDQTMMNELGRICSISKGVRQRKMSNDRIRQITTLLYLYKSYVTSEGLQHHHAEELHKVFFDRFSKHKEYYQTSAPIQTTFEYFQKIIDIWYPLNYNN